VVNIVEALNDKKLFGPLFKDLASWAAWIAWMKSVFALRMNATERELFTKCTGRQNPPQVEQSEIVTICGRRSGKSFIAALTSVYLACFRDYRPFLSPGERAMIVILARDRNQAQVIFKYVASLLRISPLLAKLIDKESAETIELTSRVTIAVYTASYRSVRGVTLAAALADEIAFWMADGANPDREILTALRPAMATIPGSKLLVLSSPYARSGVLYETHKEYFGKEHASVLVWQAPTVLMNPTIAVDFITREKARDPSAGVAEWDAQFREDLEAAFPLEIIEACVVPGRQSLPPVAGVHYLAFVDPSGGRADSFTLAIGHRKQDGSGVIDVLREWRAPLSPETTVKECCAWLDQYHIRKITGDRYGGEWPREQFAKHGVTYEECAENKSELYLAFVALLTSQSIELPDDDALKQQLVRLERRKTRSGRDMVDHPTNGEDDLANAAAGVGRLLAQQRKAFFAGLAEKEALKAAEQAARPEREIIVTTPLSEAELLASQQGWDLTDLLIRGRS
jgi:hypothetical protein